MAEKRTRYRIHLKPIDVVVVEDRDHASTHTVKKDVQHMVPVCCVPGSVYDETHGVEVAHTIVRALAASDPCSMGLIDRVQRLGNMGPVQ